MDEFGLPEEHDVLLMLCGFFLYKDNIQRSDIDFKNIALFSSLLQYNLHRKSIIRASKVFEPNSKVSDQEQSKHNDRSLHGQSD